MELLIGKNVKYAASKTSATTETATDPSLLANGSVGIYYKASDGLLTLVTAANAASGISALITGADTSADKIEYTFAVGSDTSAYMVRSITAVDVVRYFTQEATAATKQVSFLGYDGADSAKDLQITNGTGTNGAIKNYDEATVGFEVRFSEQAPVEERAGVSVSLLAGDDKIKVASKLMDAINTDARYVASITSAGAVTALATTTVTLTNGSKTVTFGSAQTIAAGDLLLVTVDPTTGITATATAPSGTNYQGYRVAVGVTAGTSITLETPFKGSTASLAVKTSVTTVASATALAAGVGLKITTSGTEPYNVYTQFELSARDVIAYSVYTKGTGFSTGSGTYKQMQVLERASYADKGIYTLNDQHIARPVSELDATATYDLFFLNFIRKANLDASNNYRQVTGENVLVLAFPDAAYGAGDNETVVKDILDVILGTNATPIAVSGATSDAGGSNNNVSPSA